MHPHEGLYLCPTGSKVHVPAPSHRPPVHAVPATEKAQSQELSAVHTTLPQVASPQKLWSGLGEGHAAFAVAGTVATSNRADTHARVNQVAKRASLRRP